MATLEKIRSKSVMLLIVIGVALLAFIIGDFLNSGRSFFGAGTTVAKVDGTKISIIDFQKRYEEYNQRLQQSNQKMDGAVVQAQVLEGMISEQLLNNEVEALGIVVTGAELTEAMTGKSANPAVMQFANQMGVETPAQLHDMIFNPGKYGVTPDQVAPLQAQWLEMETEMEKQLKYQKLNVLLMGAIQANDLDKAAIAADMSTAAKIDMVNVPYASLDDKDYAVTDEELKAQYNEDKQQFKTDKEMRKVHYIAVNVAPSQSDLAVAQALMNKVDSTLRATKGVDAIRNISELTISQRTVRANDVDAATRAFLQSADVDAVSSQTFRGDVHSQTKVLGKKMEVDSINVNMVQVQGNKAYQDSILALLNSGKPFAEVVNNETVAGQENFWFMTMQLGSDEKSLEAKQKMLTAGQDYYVSDNTDNAAIFFKVNERKSPKQMYEIAEISYKVYPSDETIDNLRTGLQEYINKNNTGKAFFENAVAAGYQPVEATLTAETAQMNRIESTRKLVQWAFGAEKGAVSPIFDKEGNDKMIALTLDEVIPAGFMPMTDPSVRMMLETKVRNSKKGDALLAKYQGKANDLAGYSALMNAPVDSAVNVTFSQDFIPALRGSEPKLTGCAPYKQQGEFVGPVKGGQSLFVYKVDAIEKSSSQLTPEQIADRYSATMGARAVSQMALDILKEGKDIENNLINFY